MAACPSSDSGPAEKWRRVGVVRWVVLALLAALAASCASFTCQPLTVVVADKQERTRLERVPYGVRTTETGRLEEDRRAEIVRDYWVRGQDGRWYPVPPDRYRAAQVGESVEVCR
jgi:hypothetical protein